MTETTTVTDHHDPAAPGCSRAAAVGVYRLRAGRVLDPTTTTSLGEALDDMRGAVRQLVEFDDHRPVGALRVKVVTAERLAAHPELEADLGRGTLALMHSHVNVHSWLWATLAVTCAPAVDAS